MGPVATLPDQMHGATVLERDERGHVVTWMNGAGEVLTIQRDEAGMVSALRGPEVEIAARCAGAGRDDEIPRSNGRVRCFGAACPRPSFRSTRARISARR